MKHFRQKPSHRREPRPTAAQIILTPEHARAAARGDVTLHLRPVTSRDHRKRFHQGQRLAVRPAVGAATICHVHVTEVRGPTFDPAPMRLGDVTFDDARSAGHRTTLDFKRAWLARHDANWPRIETVPCPDCLGDPECPADELPPCETCDGESTTEFRPDPTDDEIEARIDQQAHRPIWAVRYIVDIAGADWFLAARSDELYVHNMARALSDEPPALSPTDFDRHVAKREKLTTAQWIAHEHATRAADLEQLSLGQRLDRAVRECRAAGLSTTREIRVIEKRLQALEQHGQRRAA